MKKLLLAFLFAIPLWAQFAPPVTITAGGPNINLFTGNSSKVFLITLTGNINFQQVDTGAVGTQMFLNICQDNVGSHTWTWSTQFLNPPTIIATANVCTPATFVNIGPGQWQNQAIGNGLGGIPGITGANQIAPNLQTWYFSPNCGTQTNCTKVNGDAVVLQDCSTTNASSTVTCPDAIFRASDVGKTAWATTLGTGNLLEVNATMVCPQTTIATFNSATSVTLTAANDCTSTQTGTAAFFYGTKDGTAIKNAMNAQCANFVFSAGPGPTSAQPGTVNRMMIDQPFGNTVASPCNAPYITMSGGTPTTSSTVFTLTPDFNWAGCTGNNGTTGNVCFGAASIMNNYLSFAGFGLNGTGACPAAAQNKVIIAPSNIVSQNYELNLNGICPGTAGMIGIQLDSLDSMVAWGGAVQVGQFSTVINSRAVSGFYNDYLNDGPSVSGNGCGSGIGICAGLLIKAGAVYQDFGSWAIENAANQGTLQSHGTTFYAGTANTYALINSNGAGVAIHTSDGDFFNPTGSPFLTTSNGINSDFGAQTFYHNSQINAGASGIAVNLANDGAAVTFFDQCGNTFSGGTKFSNAGNAGNVAGTCSAAGTKLATSNIGLTSGWGTSSVASVAAFSDSHRGRFTITGAAGSAGPTLTLTFPTAYPLVAPAVCNLFENTTDIASLTSVASGTPTLTNVVFTFAGTPVAATYTFDYDCGP